MPLPASFAIGKLLDGKYRIENVIGGGGMGIIVAARHLALDQRVAVKFLRPDVLRDAETVARFAREARAAVRIRSEHVAHVLDVGESDDGTPFMVMELLEGHTMADELSKRGPLPTEEAVDFVLQLCEALAEAHAAGIVHRDLKPENLFVVDRADEWRTLKVLDFGISKTAMPGTLFANDALLTQTLSMMGSPMYMSPEQIRATKNVDHRSDIWSVGIVLYELLAGRAAYQAGSITQLCAHVLEERPPSLGEVASRVPPGLEDVIDRCLEKDVKKRYQSVAELAIDLLPFAPRSARASVERTVSVVRTRMNRGDLMMPSSLLPPPPTNEPGSSSGVNVSWSAAPPQSAAPRRRSRRRLHPAHAFGAGMCVATIAATIGALAWYRTARSNAPLPPLVLSAANAAASPPVEVAPPQAEAAPPAPPAAASVSSSSPSSSPASPASPPGHAPTSPASLTGHSSAPAAHSPPSHKRPAVVAPHVSVSPRKITPPPKTTPDIGF
ncbi:MAG: serine/threonine protein kinase [Polyangiaceae bacterium]|nr:serine/threonine protein kinase [Polyangiaceae bacterium]